MGRFVAAAVLSVAFGCLQPVSEVDAGDQVLFTLQPNWNDLDGHALLYWGPQRGFGPLEGLVAGGIIASSDALFIDGLIAPVSWDGGLFPRHPQERGFAGDPNCRCDAWLGAEDRVLKPNSWIGDEQLWLLPYTYEGRSAEPRWGHSTGLPQTSTSLPMEGATMFGPSMIRGAPQLCVAERPLRLLLRDGGLPPTSSTVTIYGNLAMTTVAARVDFMDAGADCIDATISSDGGVIALISEHGWVYPQAWRVVRVQAGAAQVEMLPGVEFCFPFKSVNPVGSLRMACYGAQRVTAWQVDMNQSQRLRSFPLPEGWVPTAALNDVTASVLALNADAGAVAVCDEAGCVTLSEWTPNYISVGIDPTDSLLLASQQSDGGVSVRRYPPQRWRR